MHCVFVQLRCQPGRTYQVADAIYERELVSELYSTSGEYPWALNRSQWRTNPRVRLRPGRNG
jgi:hypothetical protein